MAGDLINGTEPVSECIVNGSKLELTDGALGYNGKFPVSVIQKL